MKKNDLLKAITICFLIFVILSWIIPIGSYASGSFVKAETHPVGFIGLFIYPIALFNTFIQYALVFLAIGGFYGVMNKTGVYQKLVETIVKKVSKKEKSFIIMTIIILTTLSSVTGLSFVLFTIVPLLAAVILSLNYSKMTAFLSTVGAILLGNVVSTFGFEGAAHTKKVLGLALTDALLVKIILLILAIFLFVMYVLRDFKDKKKSTKKEKEKVSIPLLYQAEKNKKSIIPLVVIFSMVLVILFVGMYNWYYSLDVNFFQEIHTEITSANINGYPVLANILGFITESNVFGYWGNYEMTMVLIVASLIIGWLYNLKLKDTFDGFIDGSKEMLKVALLVIMANIIFGVTINITDGSMLMTIIDYSISSANNLNVFVITIVSALGSFFYNDYQYLVYSIVPPMQQAWSITDTGNLMIIGIIVQSVRGLMMMILPTSFIMIAGLSFLDISFKEWVKYIWKFLLEVLIIIIIICVILLMTL